MITIERIIIVASAVITCLLQMFLAPHVAVGYAVPNFMAALCLAMAIVRAETLGPVLPFVLGLLYDLMSGGPVGAMAFSLTVFSMVASAVFQRANNDTVFMAVAVLLASVLLVELTYGMFYLLFGYSANFLEALAYRVFPCFVYDAVLALVIYLVLARFLRREAPLQSEIRQVH